MIDASSLARIQQQYVKDLGALLGQGINVPSAALDDRRFADPAWRANPLHARTAALYLLHAKTLKAMAEAFEGDAKTKAKLQFSVQQYVDAMNPANLLATNPVAIAKALQTQGESIKAGLSNFLHDVAQGHISQTDESQFEVGKNVGTSEGAVVYENPWFQLIEYKPSTAKVHDKPFLIVPPCINKFYILDLQPSNSFVRYCVENGMRTFMLSWRNPREDDADADRMRQSTWDDYVEQAVLRAIETVRSITGAPQINTLGFCVGGTLLGTALAVLAAREQVGAKSPVASATFLTTFLDFSDTGVLDVFVDEGFVRYREQQFAEGGFLRGQELATTFSFLRPNELVWNYVQNNYLKGETPPAFDLLFWNSDSTNLPGPMYARYLRQTYLENNLCKPGRVKVCGEAIDLSKVTVPVYVYGSREDHIVPIGGAYASMHVLGGEKRFVMGASGHIAGVINPPAAKKRSHWIAEGLKTIPKTHAQWLEKATERPGSWWPDWMQWLKRHAGQQVAAPKAYAVLQAGRKASARRTKFTVIEPAPGRYVRAKA